MQLFKELFNSGVILAVGTIIGVFLKFILDKIKVNHSHTLEIEKLEDNWVEKEFTRLTQRILVLEDAYQKCIKGESERERAIGHLSGEVEGLKSLLVEMQKKSTKIIAEQVAHTTAQVTTQAIEATTQALEKNTEKIDSAIQTANEVIDKLDK